MRRCSRCILSEYYPKIIFSDKGICNYCLNWEKVRYKSEEKLKEIILDKKNNASKRTDPKYDCLVSASGGCDSTYVLYYLKKRLNLKILAYHNDNGFINPIAKQNLKNTCNVLNIDLVSEKNVYQKKLLKHTISIWLNNKDKETIPDLCMGYGENLFGRSYKTAKDNSIPIVVMGFSKIDFSFYNLKLRHNKNSVILDRLIRIIKNFRYNNPQLIIDYFNSIKGFIGLVPNIIAQADNIPFIPKKIKLIHFYDYIYCSEKDKLKTIKKELNWKHDKNLGNNRFDCRIHSLKSLFYNKNFRYHDREDYLSEMIREEQINRQEAISEINVEIKRFQYKKKIAKDLLEEIFDSKTCAKILKSC